MDDLIYGKWYRNTERYPGYIGPVENVVFKPRVGMDKCLGTYFPKPGIFESTATRASFRIDEVVYWLVLPEVP